MNLIMIYLVLVSLNSVIAVLDADFHSLPSIQHRQQHGPVCILCSSIFRLQISSCKDYMKILITSIVQGSCFLLNIVIGQLCQCSSFPCAYAAFGSWLQVVYVLSLVL